MKNQLIFSLLAIALIGTGCTKKQDKRQAPKPPDPNQVLIEVNGHKLTVGEAERQAEKRLGGPPPAAFSPERIKLVRDRTLSIVVDQFVKKTLLLEEADKLKITATDEEVEKAISDIRKQEAAALKSSTNSVAKTTANDDERLRREITTGIRIDKLLAVKIPPVKPTEAQVDDYIKTHNKELTNPKTKKMLERDLVIKKMQEIRRRKALTEYVRYLQSKANIRHAPNVVPPKYPPKK